MPIAYHPSPHARRFDIAWARQTIAQCQDAGVACFVKQLGSFPVAAGSTPIGLPKGMIFSKNESCDDRALIHLRDKKGGDMSEWPEDLRVRQFPEVAR